MPQHNLFNQQNATAVRFSCLVHVVGLSPKFSELGTIYAGTKQPVDASGTRNLNKGPDHC